MARRCFYVCETLFLYRDFLPVLEGKYHHVIKERDLAKFIDK